MKCRFGWRRRGIRGCEGWTLWRREEEVEARQVGRARWREVDETGLEMEVRSKDRDSELRARLDAILATPARENRIFQTGKS